MDTEYTLSLKINKLMLTFGFILILFNSIFAIICEHEFYFFIFHPNTVILLTGLLVLIIGQFTVQKTLKFYHIIILALTATFNIISDFTQFFGFGQVILLTLLLYKYEFLKKHLFPKLLFLSLFYIGVTDYSLVNSGVSGKGIEVFMYVVYFLIFLHILYKTEIDRVLFEKQKMFDEQLESIEDEKERLNREVKNKELKIANLNRILQAQKSGKCQIDMDQFGLTRSEKKIVHLLAARSMTNKDLAEQLNIKERTIKSHLFSTYNKIGVSTRTELIGLYYSLELGK
jgi:DNA-binding CsgD family transcriptional regulator